MRNVAIVGSGPAGCYLAEALLRADNDCRITVIDRLPTPFGLVRFGVAPDHQGTKGITRLLDRVLAKAEVSYFGSVELGRDVSLPELRALYDVVVLAIGAPVDRRLGIAGEELAGVLPSGRFVGWYNHHPDHVALDLAAVESAVIIGNGNVALDVARVLAKTETEFDGSDLNFAGWVKKLLGVPTITVGSVGLNGDFFEAFAGKSSQPASLDELERRLERGDFDLVAVGRALLQDPNWVVKVHQGRNDELLEFERSALATLS